MRKITEGLDGLRERLKEYSKSWSKIYEVERVFIILSKNFLVNFLFKQMLML